MICAMTGSAHTDEGWPPVALADGGGERVGGAVHGLGHRAGGIGQGRGDLVPRHALQDRRVIARAHGHEPVADHEERDGAGLRRVGLHVVGLQQGLLGGGGRVERAVAARGALVRVRLHAGEGQHVAGVGGPVERERLGLREGFGLDRRLRAAQVREAAEPTEGHHERPALGGAEGAVLGADVEDLGLAVLFERRRSRRQRLRRRDALAGAHLVQDRDRHVLRELPGLTRAAGSRGGAGMMRERQDHHHQDDHQHRGDGHDRVPRATTSAFGRGLSPLPRRTPRIGARARRRGARLAFGG